MLLGGSDPFLPSAPGSILDRAHSFGLAGLALWGGFASAGAVCREKPEPFSLQRAALHRFRAAFSASLGHCSQPGGHGDHGVAAVSFRAAAGGAHGADGPGALAAGGAASNAAGRQRLSLCAFRSPFRDAADRCGQRRLRSDGGGLRRLFSRMPAQTFAQLHPFPDHGHPSFRSDLAAISPGGADRGRMLFDILSRFSPLPPQDKEIRKLPEFRELFSILFFPQEGEEEQEGRREVEGEHIPELAVDGGCDHQGGPDAEKRDQGRQEAGALFPSLFRREVHQQFIELTMLFDHHVEDDADRKGKQGADGADAGNDQAGEAGDEAGADILRQHGDKQRQHDDQEDQGERAEEGEGLILPEQAEDGAQDAEAVGIGVELADRAGGPVAVGDGDLADQHVFIDGMDGHFGFNLKPAGKHREALPKRAAEGAVADHDIFDFGVEDPADQAAHQHIAEVMEGALVFGEVGGGKPVADDHIGLALADEPHHFGRVFGGIGIVAVDHQVAIGLDLAEHAADHIALALPVLMAQEDLFVFLA